MSELTVYAFLGFFAVIVGMAIRIREITQDIEEMLHGLGADDLRADARVRATVAQQAQTVTDKLTSWGL